VSHEAIEVVKRFHSAREADDREGTYALLADDVEWTTPHRTLQGLDEVREKLIWGDNPPDNLDIEFEDGDWQDLGGHVARETRVVQRWRETGEIATVMRVREELDIRDGKITRYQRRARPE
jgi:ketosteroid isomerase-like protein